MTAPADTIVAIATPPGRGGVGVVRLSGSMAFTIAEQLSGSLPPVRTAGLRHFHDADGEIIDTGLLIRFAGPRSYTGEDVVEIQAHGSPVVLELIVSAAVAAGARRAGPGEFSQRAFLNDRMDLVQAEAVADLIASASEKAARAAHRSLEGTFSKAVDDIHQALVELRVWVEAALDFPDEDVDFLADGQVADRAGALRTRLDSLLQRAATGRLLTDGVRIAIIGPPNAGKSSLLNALAERDAAIVTDIPGTTRDVLRETITLAGMPVVLSDTAGLRETSDRVEFEGVRRARLEMQAADLLFHVVDASEPSAHQLSGVPERLPVIRIENKVDLSGHAPGRDQGCVRVSALTGEGLGELESLVLEELGASAAGGEGEFSARQRHVDALRRALAHVESGHAEVLASGSGELLAEELRMAAEELGEITGRMSSDQLLGEIFASFCIGK
jgi:tRNA modification GTPase